MADGESPCGSREADSGAPLVRTGTGEEYRRCVVSQAVSGRYQSPTGLADATTATAMTTTTAATKRAKQEQQERGGLHDVTVTITVTSVVMRACRPGFCDGAAASTV